jgi:hypothetical protein
MEGTIGGRRKVEARLVASFEEPEWNRGPKPHILADRLAYETPKAGLVLDDQVKALRRGGSYLHYEILEIRPIRRKVRTEVFEVELPHGLGTLEGDPFGLRVSYRAKHQNR